MRKLFLSMASVILILASCTPVQPTPTASTPTETAPAVETTTAPTPTTAPEPSATPEALIPMTFMAGYKPQANLPFVGVYVAKAKGFFTEEAWT